MNEPKENYWISNTWESEMGQVIRYKIEACMSLSIFSTLSHAAIRLMIANYYDWLDMLGGGLSPHDYRWFTKRYMYYDDKMGNEESKRIQKGYRELKIH